MIQEATIQQNFQRAKKNKHNYSVATQAFSASTRQFVIYNISLKKDYSDFYDIINYRRGLSYVQQIIDFKHTQTTIARKGLRKFKDILPEYLDLKQSHVNNSKFHLGEKVRLFKGLQNPKFTSFIIYNTEKLNGENAQISFIYQRFWIIGSKNKCLLISDQQDLDKLKNRHEHKLTILIARRWFSLLKTKTQEQISGIKLQLSTKTLIGQYCNSQNNQHLIDYGKQPQIFFYALVEKDNSVDDCQPTSITFKFLDKFNLPKAKCETHDAKTFDQMIESMREIVVKMNELTLKQGGEGGVVYVSGVDTEGEHNMLICKVKTIEYRIYRKLRQKLKIYLQKYNKSYDNLLKKYTKQINEIARQFKLIRPIEEYIEFGRKSFILCEDQTRQISRFVSNRFINFMRLVDKNIAKDKFMEIVNSKNQNLEDFEDDKQPQELNKIESSEHREQQEEIKPKHFIRKVIVLIPVTIPSTGKTSLLELIKKQNPSFKIWSISSDEIKRKIMDESMKKNKTMTRKQAFDKSYQPGTKLYYESIGKTLKEISLSHYENNVFYLDKNHPQNAIKPAIKELKDKSALFPNIKLVILGLLPQNIQRLQQKGLYRYPFSSAYILTCLKRVLERPQHLTLMGTDEERCKIVFGFANNFRNFSLTPYNISKYFDDKIQFIFNNEKCLEEERDKKLVTLFKEILLFGKPGNFQNNHPQFDRFLDLLREWKLQEIPRQTSAKDALSKIQSSFVNFESIIENSKKVKQ